MLKADHRIAGIVEPFGAVFYPEHAIFEVLAIGFDFSRRDVRTHARWNAKRLPQMRHRRANLVKPAERWPLLNS